MVAIGWEKPNKKKKKRGQNHPQKGEKKEAKVICWSMFFVTMGKRNYVEEGARSTNDEKVNARRFRAVE